MTKKKKRKQVYRKNVRDSYIRHIRKCKTKDEVDLVVYRALFDDNLTEEYKTQICAIGEYAIGGFNVTTCNRTYIKI